jgi:membrane fusion protein, multidrug efflux system
MKPINLKTRMQAMDVQRTLAMPLAVLIALTLAACGKDGGEQHQMPPPQVNVAKVVQKSVTEWDDFSGRIEAVDSVEIRPRVAGYLEAVHFVEGSEVKKGDLLFTIDDREYRAAVDSAQANVARAQTRVEVAQLEAARAEKLLAVRAMSKEVFETRQGEVRQAEADRKAMQAALVQQKLNLEFSRIVSPIDGRVGEALIRPGNLVTPGTTLLTTVVSLDPIYVTFEGDERIYLKYQEMSRDGERQSSRDARNPVRVGLATDEGYPHMGEMVFVDNRMDPATGTIHAKALLSNEERLFTPGLFARVQLLGSGQHEAMLIHERAVMTDQDRKFVYVIGPNNAATRKDVKLGPQIDGLRVVTEGLAPEDLVVVNGVRKIFFPGMPVQPFTVPMDQPELAPPPPPAAPGAPGAAAGK